MNKRLNNKGYMLVEIVLASVIAMAIAYYITDLTIKLKNKNDDLLVRMLATTDQAIIYNSLMKDIYNDSQAFKCSDVTLDKENKKFIYKGFTNILSDYVDYVPVEGELPCEKKENQIIIKIPLKVKQLPDDDFTVNIDYTINS